MAQALCRRFPHYNKREQELTEEEVTEPWEIPLSKNDTVITVNSFYSVILDRIGLQLYFKHEWRYCLAIGHLYRYEPHWFNGSWRYRQILFHRQLLGFPERWQVECFLNGNTHDYRLVNFFHWSFVKYGGTNYTYAARAKDLDESEVIQAVNG